MKTLYLTCDIGKMQEDGNLAIINLLQLGATPSSVLSAVRERIKIERLKG
jgi:hypothetical protein